MSALPITFVGIGVGFVVLRITVFVMEGAQRKKKKKPKYPEESWDKLLTNVFAAAGCVAVLWTVWENHISTQESTAQARTAASFDILRRLHEPENGYFQLCALRLKLPTNATPNEVCDEIEKQRMVEPVKRMLAVFEEASIAIKAKHADEAVLYYTISNVMGWTYTNIMPIIKRVGGVRGESYLVEFKDLHEAWRNGESLVTYKRIFQGSNYVRWMDSDSEGH